MTSTPYARLLTLPNAEQAALTIRAKALIFHDAKSLALLRQDPRTATIPVVFMTAKAMPDEILRLRQLGAAEVLTKPFDPTQLAGDVRALAVDDERELLAGDETADAEVLNRKGVLAIGRKVVARDDAAAIARAAEEGLANSDLLVLVGGDGSKAEIKGSHLVSLIHHIVILRPAWKKVNACDINRLAVTD